MLILSYYSGCHLHFQTVSSVQIPQPAVLLFLFFIKQTIFWRIFIEHEWYILFGGECSHSQYLCTIYRYRILR